ncbi:HAD family phosphatase [Lichenicola cladoniae]|uniref:HAD family phosphatase n=1 Tax=Lichenicola cladoniae TaxID=1484109 RepID=A0A6M8HR82_9PROT|nr:HAD family phosphatase [Lichenicola cladoniae]NPD68163.1 HAD family phosphatase [Acetobacteraceae bacterium]QKE90731.1 HAD family phosphatase [Lichenicola cladoniae]
MNATAVVHHPIEAAIFDMDGLLLDSELLAMEALLTAGAELGYDMPRSFCHSMIGSSLDLCRAMVAAKYGSEFPVEAYFKLQERHLHALVAQGKLALKTGVVELLDLLDQRGIKHAVATSSGRARTLHHLGIVGIARRFEHIITRDDVTHPKPDPEPYLLAASRLGVLPTACLALEDSHNGVRAAHAAGMRVIMVPDLLHPNEEMHDKAHRIMESLHDVIRFLNEAKGHG